MNSSSTKRGRSRRRSGRSRRAETPQTAERRPLTLWATDAGFAALIFVLPMLLGGRQAAGQLFLVAVAAWIAVAWCLHQVRSSDAKWTRSGVEWLLICGVVVVALQLVPLPRAIHQVVSSPTGETLQLHRLPEGRILTEDLSAPKAWSRISLTPVDTVDGLSVLIAYVMVFVVAVQRLRTAGDISRLMQCIGISSAVMAVFGLVQFFATNGKFFWFYEHPFTDTLHNVKGAFTNRNHFAQFLALGIGPLLWWIATRVNSRSTIRSRDSRNQFAGDGGFGGWMSGVILVLIAVTVFAAMLSLSRGGILAVALAGGVGAFTLFRTGMLGPKMFAGLGGLALVVGSLLWIYGKDQVVHRVEKLASANVEQLDESGGRRVIWKAVAEGIRSYPLLGTGIGSHREVYPLWLREVPKYYDHEFTHAENSYLQVALESGLIGLAFVLTAFGFAVRWCWSAMHAAGTSSLTAMAAGILPALAACLGHAISDFIWYVPACVVLVILLSAAACRLFQLSRDQTGRSVPGSTLSRPVWVAMAVLAGAAGLWSIRLKSPPCHAEPHWHRYLSLALSEQPEDVSEAELLQRQMRALTATLRANPRHSRAHLSIAMGYQSMFRLLQNDSRHSDNPMSLSSFREAAFASHETADSASVDEWLNRSMGKRRGLLERALHHARRALALCPLHGRGYLFLSELSFLNDSDPRVRDACINQATRVRPFDAQVLFVAGRESVLSGDHETAMAMWRESYVRNRHYQDRILEMLAPMVPAQFLIDEFDSDVEAMESMVRQYRPLNRPSDLQTALRHFADVLLKKASDVEYHESAQHLISAHFVFRELNDMERATDAVEAALDVNRNDFRTRYVYSLWLVERQDYRAAIDHLTWCVRQNPDHESARKLLDRVRRRRDAQTSHRVVARMPHVQ